jgi:hypothetical protein
MRRQQVIPPKAIGHRLLGKADRGRECGLSARQPDGFLERLQRLGPLFVIHTNGLPAKTSGYKQFVGADCTNPL